MRTAAICPTCATYENAICVLYDGPYLPCTGISPLDSIAEALAKIDAAICALTTTTTTSSTSSTTTSSTSSTTTTTTTVNSCTAPVITDITTNGAYPQAAVTVYYDLNGIVDVLSVTISYSLDPDFGSGFNDTISNLNLTSYTIPDFTGSSTWYFRIRKVCGTDPLNPTGESYSNVVSIVPQPTTTTTTTTSCIAGLTQQILITQVNESPGGTIYILPTPIGEACALLPNIQAGSVPILNSTFPERLDGQLFIGANIIYDNCNPVASGTYALYADPLSGVTTFIEVTDGVITDIVNCSTTTTTTTVV